MTSVRIVPRGGFRFRCYNELKDNLGRTDAVVEYIELSIRSFEHRHAAEINSHVTLKSLAKSHRIVLSHIDVDLSRSHRGHLYILSVYQQVDWFFNALRAEHPEGSGWRDRRDDESILNYTLDQLGHGSRAMIPKPLLEVFEYYRLVRNCLMHSAAKRKKLDSQHRIVLKYQKVILEEYGTRAPNAFDDMNYDDFCLFTRSFKDIASHICNIGKPNDDQLIQMLMSGESPHEKSTIFRFRRFRGNESRLRLSLTNKLRAYNVRLSETLFNKIKRELSI